MNGSQTNLKVETHPPLYSSSHSIHIILTQMTSENAWQLAVPCPDKKKGIH